MQRRTAKISPMTHHVGRLVHHEPAFLCRTNDIGDVGDDIGVRVDVAANCADLCIGEVFIRRGFHGEDSPRNEVRRNIRSKI